MPAHKWQRYVPIAGGTLIVLLVLVGAIWFVREMMAHPSAKSQRQVAQQIHIIRPPPPPPDEPPPPPPPEKTEPLEQKEPEQAPEEAPPSEQLGVDADASAGGDSFGLAARKGGRDLVGTGTGAFVWYTSHLKDLVLNALTNDEHIRKGAYQVLVRMWIAPDGRVDRIRLASSSGNRDLDSAIESALGRVARAEEAPPIEMPQPVTLRIVSRS
jgi:protein TonB